MSNAPVAVSRTWTASLCSNPIVEIVQFLVCPKTNCSQQPRILFILFLRSLKLCPVRLQKKITNDCMISSIQFKQLQLVLKKVLANKSSICCLKCLFWPQNLMFVANGSPELFENFTKELFIYVNHIGLNASGSVFKVQKGFFRFQAGNRRWPHLVVQTYKSTYFHRALRSHELYKIIVCLQSTTSPSAGQPEHFQQLAHPSLQFNLVFKAVFT